MWLEGLLTAGPLPALELAWQFAGQRQSLIAHNIANLDTPNFQARDVSVAQFQRLLAEAVDRRRAATGGETGPLPWRPSPEIQRDRAGRLRLEPRSPAPGVLFHDRHQRDVERLMQTLAENAGTYRVMSELLRHEFRRLGDALAERV